MKSNQDIIVSGLFRLATAFPFMFIGPALFIGKGTTGAWYWTALSLAIMLTGVFFIVTGLRRVLRGFFGN
jgi:hypothetical protein